MMTEEQLNQLKMAIKIRLEYCEEKMKEYQELGKAFDNSKFRMECSAESYKTVLEDLEKIMNG